MYLCAKVSSFMKQEYIEKLQSWRIWSIEDVVHLSGSIYAARELMRNYIARGIVSSVRRNLYVANDLATGLPIANRFEIASKVAKDSYVGYHSALEYHGIAQQVGFNVQVCASKKIRPFSFDDRDYQYCPSAFDDGVMTPATDSMVRVSNIERTIVDCADRVDLAGGWEEILSSFEMIHRPDFHLIENYLTRYGKKSLYAKLGLLSEYFTAQWNTPQEFISLCALQCKRNLNYFTSKEDSSSYFKQWNIYIPDAMFNYITANTSHDEII